MKAKMKKNMLLFMVLQTQYIIIDKLLANLVSTDPTFLGMYNQL